MMTNVPAVPTIEAGDPVAGGVGLEGEHAPRDRGVRAGRRIRGEGH
jgi:hypothetical protein